MSDPPKSHLTTVTVVIAILILVAVGFAISQVGKKSDDDETAAEKARVRISKSVANRDEPARERGGYRKSEGKTEEEKKGWGEILLLDRKEMMIQVSIKAREDLKAIREKHKTKYDDPAVRQAFSKELMAVKDPQERQKILQKRTAEMRKARAAADASKGFQERATEKRLIVLMQVQNLYRMGEYVAKSPDMKQEALAFDDRLAEWVQGSEEMDDPAFHKTFTQLRNDLNVLRQRNAKYEVHTPYNPSPRPQPNSGATPQTKP